MTKTIALESASADGWDQLPQGWKLSRVDSVCSVNPRRPALNRAEQTLTSFLSMHGIDEMEGVISALETRPFAEVARGFTYFEENDVLFAKITPSMENGKCAIARGLIDGFGFGSTEFHVIRPGASVIPGWVHYYLRRRAFRLEARDHFRGAVGQQRVPPDFISSSQIPIPPSTEIQERIVTRVDSLLIELKEARGLHRAMIDDSGKAMDAALLEVFGHAHDGLRVINVPQEQVKPLELIAKVERGKFSPRPRNDPKFFGGSVPWVQIQNLPKDYSKYITTYMNTLNEQGLAVSRRFPRGTLVISIAATIGAVGILEFEACFPDSLVGITPDSSIIDVGFLYWQLLFLRDYLEKSAPSAAQKNINLQRLKPLEFWVPPRPQQEEINHYLDSIQSDVGEMWSILDDEARLLEQVEQAILEQAFRGEL